MMMKTIATSVTLCLLACLGLAIGGVFGQDAPAVTPAPTVNAASTRVLGYQTQPAQPTRFAVSPDGAILQFTPATPAQAAEGAHDEDAAKLIASDAQMRQESQALLGQYSEATDDEQKARIKDQLAETLDKQFSVQQQLREREVAKIEARVKKLRELINKRNDAKRSIIDKRLDQLIREAEGLGWNAPAAGPANSNGAGY